MATRVVVPITRRCCTTNKFSDAFPSALNGYATPDEFRASVARINAANRPAALTVVVHLVCCVIYVQSIMWFLRGYGYFSTQYDYYYDTNYSWFPLATLFTASVLLLLSARWMRNRRIDALTKQVLVEHENYSHRAPQMAMRIVNPGTRSASLEIDLLGQANINYEQQPGAAVAAAAAPPTYSVQQAPAQAVHQPLPLPTPAPVQHQLIAPVPVYPSVHPHATGLITPHPSAPYVPFFSHPQPTLYASHTQATATPINAAHYPELRQSLIGHQY